MSDTLKVTILGSCSGTEPKPGRHHTSIAMEYGNRTYWFDAGENCAHAGHTGGIDLPGTEAVFLSHPHMDHFGGMPNLFWTLGKLTRVDDEAHDRLTGRTIDVYLPDMRVWEPVVGMLTAGDKRYDGRFELNPQRYGDGVIFDRHGMRVTALHNTHAKSDGPPVSFSFRIDAGGKAVVFSGDVKHVSEVESLLDGADLFLMETGHHAVDEVCTWLRDSGKRIGKLVFVHHGRAILADPAGELAKAQAILGDMVVIADDGTTFGL